MNFTPQGRKGQPGSLCSELLRAGAGRGTPVGHPSASSPLSEMIEELRRGRTQETFLNCYLNLDICQRDREYLIT